MKGHTVSHCWVSVSGNCGRLTGNSDHTAALGANSGFDQPSINDSIGMEPNP